MPVGHSEHYRDGHCPSDHSGANARLTRESDELAKRTSDVYKALRRSQRYQFNNYSCSVATVAMLINGARRLLNNEAILEEIDQRKILERVNLGHWAERVSDAGYKGRHGLPFSDFGRVVKAGFDAFNIPVSNIETVATPPQAVDQASRRNHLRAALESMTSSDRELIGAYFTQGVFIGQWHGHHISPVGAYNVKGQRVLILDVDAERFEPYWVQFERFFEGLLGRTNIYNDKGGGYVRIRL